MTRNYVFDVDGTLTTSRGKIDEEFKTFLLEVFIPNFQMFLVTGSDYEKTLEQVGPEILYAVSASYNCAGNSVWSKGIETYKSDWELPTKARNWLTDKLQKSPFPFRSGRHIDERPGLVNFSVIGRNCTLGERKMYLEYDELNRERITIAEEFNDKFLELQIVAQVAGETGLDIMPMGKDKRQIIKYIPEPIHFFGDMMQEGGNDYPLRVALGKNSEWTEVRNWKETYNFLKKMVYN